MVLLPSFRFRKSREWSGDPLGQVRVFLSQMEQRARENPKAALKLIRKKSKHFETAVRINGPLFQEFGEVLRPLLPHICPDVCQSTLPSVAAVSYSTTNGIQDLYHAARRLRNEIIYIVPDIPKDDADAFSQIKGLCEFSNDPKVVMVNLTETAILFRRSFILLAAYYLKAESQQLISDLADLAQSKGLIERSI